MSRLVWLKADAMAATEAAAYPANVADVELILDFLEATAAERKAIASQLRRSLSQPVDGRRTIPVTRPDGLYVLLPSRLAAWLLAILSAPTATRNEVRLRLSDWLMNHSLTAECVTAAGK